MTDPRDERHRVADSKRHRDGRYLAAAAVIGVAVAAVAVWQLRPDHPATVNSSPPSRVGIEDCPSSDIVVAMNRMGDVQGGAEVVLVDDLGAQTLVSGDLFATEPAFSPDGDELALRRGSRDHDAEGPPVVDVWAVAVSGSGTPRQLTAGDQVTGGPDWSADGEAIVYAALDLGDRTSRVQVIGAEGGESTTLLEVPAGVALRAAAWSPDGTQIALLRDASESAGESTPVELWVMGADGSQQRQVTEVPEANWISWQPDGDRMLVSTFVRESGRVITVDLASGTTETAAEEATLARVTEDGTVWFFTKEGTTSSALWKLAHGAIAHGELRTDQVSPAPEEYLYPYFGMDVRPCSG